MRSPVLERAEFDPKLRLYLVIQGAAVLLATVVGIVAVPFWAVGGSFWARRYYERLECVLTERSLAYRKGILFRSETTIPLDKIQDLTVKYGPVLDWLGLAKLSVVTAGQHASEGAAVGLVGVVDAPAFRDRVLEQRDRVVEGRGGGRRHASGSEASVPEGGRRPESAGSLARIEETLREIRDLLRSRRE